MSASAASTISAISSSRLRTYRYNPAALIPTASATARMVTDRRPPASASSIAAAAIWSRLSSLCGPRVPRTGRFQIVCGLTPDMAPMINC